MSNKETRFRFNSIVRNKSKRQYYFPIPKAYVDDGYIKDGKRYELLIKELEEKQDPEKVT